MAANNSPRAMPPLILTDLPADMVQHIVARMTLAHYIARAAPSCHVVSVAARNAIKVRKFSREVVMLAPCTAVLCTERSTAAFPDGCLVTGDQNGVVKLWRDCACERTVLTQANTNGAQINALVVLSGGARFVSVSSGEATAKLWTLDGNLERTIEVGGDVIKHAITATPDGLHFVVGLCAPSNSPNNGEVKLYHVDGTLVHTFKGHHGYVGAVVVTLDGQHIISGGYDKLVRVSVGCQDDFRCAKKISDAQSAPRRAAAAS